MGNPEIKKKKIKMGLINAFMTYIIDEQAWIILFLMIPFSLAYDIFCYLKTRFNSFSTGTSLTHLEEVKGVQRQVRKRTELGDKRLMCTARPGWKSISLQRLTYKERSYKIKIDMGNILSLNGSKKTVLVEPMVTIGQLNDYLVELGWTLPVVPELDDLTIGGLVMGGGIESTSHKYGLFQNICKGYELVLADGSCVWCSESENEELFCSIPFSYGTLGFLTAVELMIIPYKPYLKISYIPVYSLDEIVDKFVELTDDPKVDSVEGIMYGIDRAVIMSGEFVETSEIDRDKINPIGRWYKEWFYTYVEKFLENREIYTEYIPTRDFYHRHNRSWFWLMRYVIKSSNSPWFRWLFGWSMPPKYSMMKFLRQNFVPSAMVNNFVCQDIGFSLKNLKKALLFVDEITKIYPIWLCPTRHIIDENLQKYAIFKQKDVQVDIGIYGYSPVPGYEQVKAQKAMERYAIDQMGFVALYAETQLTREDFDEMFKVSIGRYHKLRAELGCDGNFPHIYEKISKLGREPS